MEEVIDKFAMAAMQSRFTANCILKDTTWTHDDIACEAYFLANAMIRARQGYVKSENFNTWITWHGGKCPVSSNTLVDVRLNNGKYYGSMGAYQFFWNQTSGDEKILQYRLSK